MMINVTPDNPSSEDTRALIAEHLSGMDANSPPGHVHALAIEDLSASNISFWSARIGGALCGCGALKELSAQAGEIKSMRTRSGFQRRGVGQAVLDEILCAARERGYTEVFLETGTGEAFEVAHRLYLRNGFEWCGPFADYRATDFNVFMRKRIVR